MNTNNSFNRKAALQQSIAHGKSLTKSVAPAEFLSLVAYTDPLNFDRGVHLLADQIGVKETDIRAFVLLHSRIVVPKSDSFFFPVISKP